MKVKLLISRSGLDGAFSPGDEIDVSDNEAVRMVAAGQCEPVDKAAFAKAKAAYEKAETAEKAAALKKAASSKVETADKSPAAAKAETTAKA